MNPTPFYGPGDCFLCVWNLDATSQLTIYGSAVILVAMGIYVLHCFIRDKKI